MNSIVSDRFPVRVVVLCLAFVVSGGLAAITYLASVHTEIPSSLDRLVFTALGSLGTLLATTKSSPQDVNVTNDEDAPVPVEDAGQVNYVGIVVVVVLLLIVCRIFGII